MNRIVRSVFLALTLLASVSVAQPQAGPEVKAGQVEARSPGDSQAMGSMQSQGAPGRDAMDTSMMRMAEMCERMMKQSMAAMPYAMSAGIGLGILLTLALLLLIVLEVQWIIFWRRRLKARQ